MFWEPSCSFWKTDLKCYHVSTLVWWRSLSICEMTQKYKFSKTNMKFFSSSYLLSKVIFMLEYLIFSDCGWYLKSKHKIWIVWEKMIWKIENKYSNKKNQILTLIYSCRVSGGKLNFFCHYQITFYLFLFMCSKIIGKTEFFLCSIICIYSIRSIY